MPIEPTHFDPRTQSARAAAVTVCPNCRAEMPGEMRFCRACGFRLGEGVAEFTETVRLDKKPTGAPQPPPTQATNAPQASATAAPKWNSCASVNEWGALAVDMSQKAIQKATKHLEEKQRQKQEQKKQPPPPPLKKESRHRSGFMGWVILIIIISIVSSVGVSGLRGLRDNLRGLSSSSRANATRSWVGTSSFRAVDGGGVTFDKVEPAGSPADKAGLVGGDIITSFDGQPVKSGDELRKLLTAMPIGKTVEVVYLRDGETRTTTLTTASKAEIERLEEHADARTEGYIGEGTDLDRVPVPGTKLYGVQLNDIRANNPAEIAGLRNGDIVIEFGGVPTRTRLELESRIERAEPGSIVTVVLMRGAERVEIPVKIGHD